MSNFFIILLKIAVMVIIIRIVLIFFDYNVYVPVLDDVIYVVANTLGQTGASASGWIHLHKFGGSL